MEIKDSYTLDEVLSAIAKERTDRYNDFKDYKNVLVRNQNYEAAAAFRDSEREIWLNTKKTPSTDIKKLKETILEELKNTHKVDI